MVVVQNDDSEHRWPVTDRLPSGPPEAETDDERSPRRKLDAAIGIVAEVRIGATIVALIVMVTITVAAVVNAYIHRLRVGGRNIEPSRGTAAC